MRRALPLLAISAMGLGGCHLLERNHDSGPRATRDYKVGAFTKLEVGGSYDVEVRTGSAPSVHAEGGQNRLDKMEVRVDGDTLHISPQKGIHWSWNSVGNGKVKLIVTVPALSGAEIAGSGDIRVDRVTGPLFKGGVAGSGDLKLAQVDAQEVNLEIAGSGSVSAAGKANSVKYEIAGSGDIAADQLVAQTATISITGSGGIHAHATGTARVEVIGSGDIILTGGAKCDISKTGSGDIRCS